jgi:hypothetical protein
MDKDEIILNTYEENNFPSLEKLFQILKKKNINISRKEIKLFLDSQIEQQLTTTQYIKNSSGKITALILNECWQIDLFNLQKYAHDNKNYSYILAVVDVFSRRAWAVATKDKEAITITNALQSIIDDNNGEPPRVITGDNDSNYTSAIFQNLLDKYKIVLDMNVINDHHTLGIIDNFAKRIKTFFTLKFLRTKSKNWINLLTGFIKNYNNSEHKALDYLTPNESILPENHMKIEQMNLIKEQQNKTVSDLVINNKVRIRIDGIFTKKTEPRWSDKFYTVEKTIGNTVYLSNGIKYKRNNLLKIPDDTKEINKNIIKINNQEEKVRKIIKKNDLAPVIDTEKRSQRI